MNRYDFFSERLSKTTVPTQNFFSNTKINECIEIFDMSNDFVVSYYHWLPISDLLNECITKQKSIYEFTLYDFKLLTNNSWLILLTTKIDKVIKILVPIPFEDFTEFEKSFLNEIRPELFTLH